MLVWRRARARARAAAAARAAWPRCAAARAFFFFYLPLAPAACFTKHLNLCFFALCKSLNIHPNSLIYTVVVASAGPVISGRWRAAEGWRGET